MFHSVPKSYAESGVHGVSRDGKNSTKYRFNRVALEAFHSPSNLRCTVYTRARRNCFCAECIGHTYNARRRVDEAFHANGYVFDDLVDDLHLFYYDLDPWLIPNNCNLSIFMQVMELGVRTKLGS